LFEYVKKAEKDKRSARVKARLPVLNLSIFDSGLTTENSFYQTIFSNNKRQNEIIRGYQTSCEEKYN